MSEVRIHCPECGVFDGCSANTDTRAWKCHRGQCEAAGRLSPDEVAAYTAEGKRRRSEAQERGTQVAEYDYVDWGGELLLQVVRYEPKTFRQRRPDGSTPTHSRKSSSRRSPPENACR